MSKEKPTTTEQRAPWAAYVEAELGFRNHWYPAFFGSELAEADVSAGLGEAVTQVKSVVVLGERILFRRVEGQVYAIHDQCIHKGVAFSKKNRVLYQLNREYNSQLNPNSNLNIGVVIGGRSMLFLV